MSKDDGERFGEYSEAEKRRIRHIRAVRAGMAIVLGLFALVVPITYGSLDHTNWSQLHQAVFVILFIGSLISGWKPGYETWFGDPAVYVDESDIDREEGSR